MISSRMLVAVACGAVSLLFLNSFSAAQTKGRIQLQINNVVTGQGQLLIGLCRKEEYLKEKCTRTKALIPNSNPLRVDLEQVKPDTYAVQVVYDRNKNFKLDTNLFGAPSEPVGFSRDATGRMGPPKFADAQFQYAGEEMKLTINLY